MQERPRRKDVVELAAETIALIDSTLDLHLLRGSPSSVLGQQGQMAARRWLVNTSIIQVLSNRIGIPKPEVVTMLAEKTTGMVPSEERKIAITEGFKMTGIMFGQSLIREVQSRLKGF